MELDTDAGPYIIGCEVSRPKSRPEIQDDVLAGAQNQIGPRKWYPIATSSFIENENEYENEKSLPVLLSIEWNAAQITNRTKVVPLSLCHPFFVACFTRFCWFFFLLQARRHVVSWSNSWKSP